VLLLLLLPAAAAASVTAAAAAAAAAGAGGAHAPASAAAAAAAVDDVVVAAAAVAGLCYHSYCAVAMVAGHPPVPPCDGGYCDFLYFPLPPLSFPRGFDPLATGCHC
jgi:hypothetical protein